SLAVVVAARAEHVLDEAPRLRPRDRIEQEPERDARDQQRRVPPGVILLPLQAVTRPPEVIDRVAQLVANVVVGRDAARERDRALLADQVRVDLAGAPEGAKHFLAQLLVCHRPLDVRFEVLSRLADPVLGFHLTSLLSWGPTCQTVPGRGPHPCRLRRWRKQQLAADSGKRLRIQRSVRLDRRRGPGDERRRRPARSGPGPAPAGPRNVPTR